MQAKQIQRFLFGSFKFLLLALSFIVCIVLILLFKSAVLLVSVMGLRHISMIGSTAWIHNYDSFVTERIEKEFGYAPPKILQWLIKLTTCRRSDFLIWFAFACRWLHSYWLHPDLGHKDRCHFSVCCTTRRCAEGWGLGYVMGPWMTKVRRRFGERRRRLWMCFLNGVSCSASHRV